METTETCTISTTASSTTQYCYSPTDLYSDFFIEFLIVVLIIKLGIYLYKQINK